MFTLLDRSLRTVLDVAVLSIAYWLAFLFRFELQITHAGAGVLFVSWPYVIALQYAALAAWGIPRMAWRYVSMDDTKRVFIAMACSGVVLLVLRLLTPMTGISILVGPLGVLATDFVLAFVGIVGVRAAWRLRSESHARRRRMIDGERHRVLLIGAGEAGGIVLRELMNRPDLGLVPVGFVDDNSAKLGTHIGGLQVLGKIEDVAQIAERKRAKRALITIATASGADKRQITNHNRAA